MKILVADDDPDLLLLLRFSLVQAGYEVVCAEEGYLAIKRFEEEAPQMAVLDINMPGANGFEVCLAIRQRSEIPILMLTARDAEEDSIRAFECGADDYVTKPFSPRVLLARVHALTRRIPSEPTESPDVDKLASDSNPDETSPGTAE